MDTAQNKQPGKPKGGGGFGEVKGGGGSGSNKGGISGKKGVGLKGEGTETGEESMCSLSPTLGSGSGKGMGEGKRGEEGARVTSRIELIGKKVGTIVGELTGVA